MKNRIKLVGMLLSIMMLTNTYAEHSILPTNLKITVIDGLGNIVEGATVKIFLSKQDYMDSKNPVAEAKTDKNGVVKFKKLTPSAYYIDARSGDKNNDGEGVETEPLSEGKTNKVNVVIE